MNEPTTKLPGWKVFAFELTVYAALLVAYFYLVLHFLGGWFVDLYEHNRTIYAVAALAVMIGQAVGLEIVSSVLVWAVNGNGKKK